MLIHFLKSLLLVLHRYSKQKFDSFLLFFCKEKVKTNQIFVYYTLIQFIGVENVNQSSFTLILPFI